MKDFVLDGEDLRIVDTSIYKARNILQTQIGSLTYAPEFGIDYDLFFGSDFRIQTETFQAYAIQKLSENGINPVDVMSQEGQLDSRLEIPITN